MLLFNKLDQAILNFCTKFSHKLQRATGITCYFLARIGVALTAISVIADAINYFHQFLPGKTILFSVAVDGMILLSCFLRSVACQRGEESIGESTKPSELLLYMQTGLWRLVWVVFLVVDLFTTATHVFGAKHQPFMGTFLQQVMFSLGLSLFYYFIAVDPLPPGTSKVREWLSNFGRVLKPAYQTNR